jgi:hypothetical protein
MIRLIFLFLAIILSSGCSTSRIGTSDIEFPKPDGLVGEPGEIFEFIPDDNASVADLEKALNTVTTKEAALTAVKKVIITRLNRKKAENREGFLYILGVIGIAGMAVCVGLYIWLPIGKRIALAGLAGFAALTALGFTMPIILQYIVYLAALLLLGIVGFAIYLAKKLKDALVSTAKYGDTVEAIDPKSDELEKTKLQQRIAQLEAGTAKIIDKIRGK